MNYYCFICKEPITEAEFDYSKNHFYMPLCRKHQDVQRQIQSKGEPEQEDTPSVSETEKSEPKNETLANSEKRENGLTQWLTQWAAARPINQSLTAKHFFIEGMRLEELARDAIAKAKDEILVTTPYLDNCFLVTALQEARNRRANVKIITRRPNSKDDKEYSKLECQGFLRKNGISIHYDNTIHAKIIVIDQTIAIVSSMNIYSGSTGGGSVEAGIVTFERSVVESIGKYVSSLLEKPESPDLASVKSPNWRNTRHF
jgi:phosphatidylserine/phosphatidylglycerophosphate/cardiolipin synthase-like enzyme